MSLALALIIKKKSCDCVHVIFRTISLTRKDSALFKTIKVACYDMLKVGTEKNMYGADDCR